jgi:glutathione S-transferase
MNSIDFIKQANQDVRYTAINPTGHIPMIEEGQFKVLGGNHVIYVYLCKHA